MDQILEYERLVYSVVKKFQNHYDVEDLKQVGMIGLMKAYKNYEEGYNTKFSTYAYKYILGEILQYIRNSKILKVNKEMQGLYQKILQVKEYMTQKLMREPTTFEIACFLEMDEREVEDAVLANQFVKSLDYALNPEEEDKDMNMYDFTAFEEASYNPEYLDLQMALESLPEEERTLIYDRYFQDLTQTEISKKQNTSQVQICRSEAKILKKLRNELAA